MKTALKGASWSGEELETQKGGWRATSLSMVRPSKLSKDNSSSCDEYQFMFIMLFTLSPFKVSRRLGRVELGWPMRMRALPRPCRYVVKGAVSQKSTPLLNGTRSPGPEASKSRGRGLATKATGQAGKFREGRKSGVSFGSWRRKDHFGREVSF